MSSAPLPKALHPVVQAVTDRIRARSATTRAAYLAQVQAMRNRPRGFDRMGCANIAHTTAPMPKRDQIRIVSERTPHIGVVTAYNDMLSAHTPYATYPAVIADEARKRGATMQVAGGVPAMCDGITQGLPGMELSLFSRDVIAQGAAVGLSHDVFDCALMLGVCDKIVPGLLIGALHFGHLPTVFVPAGPMTSGLSNSAKAKVREEAAKGNVGRDELLKAEQAAYHGVGTCTFYGTANSNQMLLEAMGLHVPGSAFVQPAGADGGALREALTREAVGLALQAPPIGELVDERCIVNAMVALLCTGGSTNHLIHWVAVARAAGISINWDDFAELSDAVPLVARVYPNGTADVNEFQAAGGPGFVIGDMIDGGFMHADVRTVSPAGFAAYRTIPSLADEKLQWKTVAEHAPDRSAFDSIVRSIHQDSGPFSLQSGLKLLRGEIGRACIKVSAVPDDRHVVQAAAKVFNDQDEVLAAFKSGELEAFARAHAAHSGHGAKELSPSEGGVIVVVRFQGPAANGMPELHKLTPPLAVLQAKGLSVALVTDGRMSGASGKVPAAIHLSPEGLRGGGVAKVRDGDVIRVDCVAGTLSLVGGSLDGRDAAQRASEAPGSLGRGLFNNFRANVASAEEGACSW